MTAFRIAAAVLLALSTTASIAQRDAVRSIEELNSHAGFAERSPLAGRYSMTVYWKGEQRLMLISNGREIYLFEQGQHEHETITLNGLPRDRYLVVAMPFETDQGWRWFAASDSIDGYDDLRFHLFNEMGDRVWETNFGASPDDALEYGATVASADLDGDGSDEFLAAVTTVSSENGASSIFLVGLTAEGELLYRDRLTVDYLVGLNAAEKTPDEDFARVTVAGWAGSQVIELEWPPGPPPPPPEFVYRNDWEFSEASYALHKSWIEDEVEAFRATNPRGAEEAAPHLDLIVRASSGHRFNGTTYREDVTFAYAKLEAIMGDAVPLMAKYRRLSALGEVRTSEVEYKQLGTELIAVADEMADAGTHPYLIGTAYAKAAEYFRLAGSQATGRDRGRALGNAMRSLVEAADLTNTPEAYREVIADRLVNYADTYTALTLDQRERLCTAVEASPKSDRWVVNAMWGAYHIERGYAARGQQFAQDVSEEGWAALRFNLAAANQRLSNAYDLRPHWPGAPTDMIRVALSGASNEPASYWFEKAIETRPDHFDAYSYYANYLLPRWHGSIAELRQLAQRAAASSKPGDSLPFVYVTVLTTLDDESGANGDVWRDAELKADALHLARQYVEHPPSHISDAIRYAIPRRVAFYLWWIADWENMHDMLSIGGAKVESMASPAFDNVPFIDRFRRDAVLISSPVWETASKGLQAMRDRNRPQARRFLKQALDELKQRQGEIDPAAVGDPESELLFLLDTVLN
ncbi:MAG: DUF4034 domain-containing protein [Planctomycetota bacterium]